MDNKKLSKEALAKAVKEKDEALERHDWSEEEIRQYFDVRQKDEIEENSVEVRNGQLTVAFYRERKVDGEMQRKLAGLKDKGNLAPQKWKEIINIPMFGPAKFPKQPEGTQVKGLYTEKKDGKITPVVMVQRQGEKALRRLEGKQVEI